MHRERGRTGIRRLTLIVASLLALAGCASRAPLGLESDPPDAPSPRAAQSDPARYQGRAVRWGGEILKVENASRSTRIEVFGRPLFGNAEPKSEGGDGVRFIAEVPRFLDPAQYRRGKRLTVLGRLAGNRVQAVGEYPYPYPVVDVEHYHLWPAYRPARDAAWHYDRYYDPWWPWGPFGPYRRWPYGW